MAIDGQPTHQRWTKETAPVNRGGRPKGSVQKKSLDVKKRLLGKWQTHPVDKLVKLANFIEPSNPELAGKIWLRLLDSCELEERKNKNSLPPMIAGEETTSEIDALKQLEEIENGSTKQINSSSDSVGMAPGEITVQTETVPTEDLPGYKIQ